MKPRRLGRLDDERVGIDPTAVPCACDDALDFHAPALSRVEAEDLMRRAPALCPYSNATRGNVDVTLRVDAMPIASDTSPAKATPSSFPDSS